MVNLSYLLGYPKLMIGSTCKVKNGREFIKVGRDDSEGYEIREEICKAALKTIKKHKKAAADDNDLLRS